MFRSGMASQAWRSQSLKGFSLAEVLIAIVIITILTIGSIAVYSTQIAKARDTERVNDIRRIQGFLDQFIAAYGTPPGPGIASAVRLTGAVKTDCLSVSDLNTCFTTVGYSTTEDLYEVLTDPSQGIPNNQSAAGNGYGYLYNADDNTYRMCTMLEDQGSNLLNTNYAGTGANAGSGDDLYCLTYTPPGVAAPVSGVSRLTDLATP